MRAPYKAKPKTEATPEYPAGALALNKLSSTVVPIIRKRTPGATIRGWTGSANFVGTDRKTQLQQWSFWPNVMGPERLLLSMSFNYYHDPKGQNSYFQAFIGGFETAMHKDYESFVAELTKRFRFLFA